MPGSVIVVGAGPAGTTLAYLLARRSVPVTLLETHPDLRRAFRGEGLQPSGLDALRQMGLGAQVDQLPKNQMRWLEIYRDGRRQARIALESLGMETPWLISQPALLEMVVGEARRHPSFRLETGVTVRELLREGERVIGVRADTPAGSREYRADLVVGTDGRHAVTRKQGGFTELTTPQSFDILWLKVPMPAYFPDCHTGRFELAGGNVTALLPASDGKLQVGLIIAKGSSRALRAAGADEWTAELLRRVSPELAAHLHAHREAVARAVLLDVICGRLTAWTRPGLLLLGDAAHPMSPVGGQGINLALRDTLVAANHLCPVLTGTCQASALDDAARRVQEERMPEIATMQELQRRQARLLFEPRRLGNRITLWLLPLLARSGLVALLFRRRMSRFAHGVVPVRLTA
jgi:2-polyprenyl-6-methoxyphenol hydroxylase-like FAD-dependent oxidoreductase